MVGEGDLRAVGSGFHQRRIVGIKPEEEHAFIPGLGVIILQPAVGADIPVKHINIHVGIDLF